MTLACDVPALIPEIVAVALMAAAVYALLMLVWTARRGG